MSQIPVFAKSSFKARALLLGERIDLRMNAVVDFRNAPAPVDGGGIRFRLHFVLPFAPGTIG